MKKTEINRNYENKNIDGISDELVPVIELNNIVDGYDQISKSLRKKFNDDFLDRAGVYFIKLVNGFYIGFSENLEETFKELLDQGRKKITNLSFAVFDRKNKKLSMLDINDLESILLNYVLKNGLTISEIKTNDERFVQNDELEDKELEEEVNNFGSNYSELIITKDVHDHNLDLNHKLYDYVEYRDNLPHAYDSVEVDIFVKPITKKALYMYLFLGKSIDKTDNAILKGYEPDIWITATTLAYLRIQTNGGVRGILKNWFNKDEAKALINEFVDECF